MKTSTAIGVGLALIIGFVLGASRGASEFNFGMGFQKIGNLFEGGLGMVLTVIVFGVIVVAAILLSQDGWTRKEMVLSGAVLVLLLVVASEFGWFSAAWNAFNFMTIVLLVLFFALVAALTAVTMTIYKLVGNRRQSTAPKSGAKLKGGGRK